MYTSCGTSCTTLACTGCDLQAARGLVIPCHTHCCVLAAAIAYPPWTVLPVLVPCWEVVYVVCCGGYASDLRGAQGCYATGCGPAGGSRALFAPARASWCSSTGSSQRPAGPANQTWRCNLGALSLQRAKPRCKKATMTLNEPLYVQWPLNKGALQLSCRIGLPRSALHGNTTIHSLSSRVGAAVERWAVPPTPHCGSTPHTPSASSAWRASPRRGLPSLPVRRCNVSSN